MNTQHNVPSFSASAANPIQKRRDWKDVEREKKKRERGERGTGERTFAALRTLSPRSPPLTLMGERKWAEEDLQSTFLGPRGLGMFFCT